MIKTRFAPSPTGFLHVGGARTALFSYLYARQKEGQFVLRIEDTDLERSTQESVDAILDGMKWLGLEHDEGPIYQTQRFDRYEEIIQQLLNDGNAYRCTCSKEHLEALREQQMADKQKPRYDGCCRSLNLDADIGEHVVRFKNPAEGMVSFTDLVKGKITFSNDELDDLIIARSNGTPTYNLTVVVDDMDMEITHVVRGDDHVNNTPRQINILKALGAPTPEYAHVPMILGDDGKRLSKRHGAVGVMQYAEDGYLPEALINYLVRLGWSHGDQEIFDIEELKTIFALDDINKAASSFNTDKLNWLNQHYLKEAELPRIIGLVTHRLALLGVDDVSQTDMSAIVDLYRERCKTINELAESILYYFHDFDEYDAKAAKKVLRGVAAEPLQAMLDALTGLSEWTTENIQQCIDETVVSLDVNMGKVGQPLRVAVTGGSFSPPINQTLHNVGQDKTIKRIQKALLYIQNRVSNETS